MEKRVSKSMRRGVRRRGEGREAEEEDHEVQDGGGKVNGRDESAVAKMIKKLFHEKFYDITKCFQARYMGQEGASNSW